MVRQPERQFTRRKALIGAGAASLPFVAGCSGGEDPTDPDPADGDSEDDTPESTWVSGLVFQLVEDINWNPYEPGALAPPLFGQHAEYVPLALWDSLSDTTVPVALRDWERDGDTIRLTLKEGFEWTNGESVTGQDLLTSLALEHHTLLEPMASQVSDWQLADDYVVELTLESESINMGVFWHDLLRGAEANPASYIMAAPHSIYGEYLDQFEDATTESEEEDIREELINFRLEEPVGCGPFHYNSDRSETESAYFELREDYDYPLGKIQNGIEDRIDIDFSDWPDEFLIPEVELINYEGRHAELMIQDIVDAQIISPVPVTDELVDSVPDHFEIRDVPAMSGSAILYDHDHKWFSKREVRKAFSYLVPRYHINDIGYANTAWYVENQTGLPPGVEEHWISDDLLDQMIDYPPQSDEEAADLLEEAGFTRDDGTWYDWEDEEFSFEYEAPLDMAQPYLAMAEYLQDFGIDANLNTVEYASIHDIISSGDYDIVMGEYGSGHPHAYHTMYANFGGDTAETSNYPEEVTVPAIDGDGEMTVNVVETLEEIAGSPDEDRNRELIQELAWVWNQDIPRTATMSRGNAHGISWDAWRYPEPNTPFYSHGYPWWYAFIVGQVQPDFNS